MYLYGIVASEGDEAYTYPSFDTQMVGKADFVERVFEWGTSGMRLPVDPSEVVDNIDRIQAGKGLLVLADDSLAANTNVHLVDNFAAWLLPSQFTMVIEFFLDITDGPDYSPITFTDFKRTNVTSLYYGASTNFYPYFELYDNPTLNGYGSFRDIYIDQYGNYGNGNDNSFYDPASVLNYFGGGLVRVAFTRVDDFLALSINGSPEIAFTQYAPVGYEPPISVGFGKNNPFTAGRADSFIRVVEIYPPMPSADLPYLSALKKQPFDDGFQIYDVLSGSGSLRVNAIVTTSIQDTTLFSGAGSLSANAILQSLAILKGSGYLRAANTQINRPQTPLAGVGFLGVDAVANTPRAILTGAGALSVATLDNPVFKQTNFGFALTAPNVTSINVILPGTFQTSPPPVGNTVYPIPGDLIIVSVLVYLGGQTIDVGGGFNLGDRYAGSTFSAAWGWRVADGTESQFCGSPYGTTTGVQGLDPGHWAYPIFSWPTPANCATNTMEYAQISSSPIGGSNNIAASSILMPFPPQLTTRQDLSKIIAMVYCDYNQLNYATFRPWGEVPSQSFLGTVWNDTFNIGVTPKGSLTPNGFYTTPSTRDKNPHNWLVFQIELLSTNPFMLNENLRGSGSLTVNANVVAAGIASFKAVGKLGANIGFNFAVDVPQKIDRREPEVFRGAGKLVAATRAPPVLPTTLPEFLYSFTDHQVSGSNVGMGAVLGVDYLLLAVATMPQWGTTTLTDQTTGAVTHSDIPPVIEVLSANGGGVDWHRRAALTTLVAGTWNFRTELWYAALPPPTPFSWNGVGAAIDLDNKLVWWYNPWTKLWNNDYRADPFLGIGGSTFTPVGTFYAKWSGAGAGSNVTANFGASPFQGPQPLGFSAWGAETTWAHDITSTPGLTFSADLLTLSAVGGNIDSAYPQDYFSCQSTTGHDTGKFYLELTINNFLDDIFRAGFGLYDTYPLGAIHFPVGIFQSDGNTQFDTRPMIGNFTSYTPELMALGQWQPSSTIQLSFDVTGNPLDGNGLCGSVYVSAFGLSGVSGFDPPAPSYGAYDDSNWVAASAAITTSNINDMLLCLHQTGSSSSGDFVLPADFTVLDAISTGNVAPHSLIVLYKLVNQPQNGTVVTAGINGLPNIIILDAIKGT